MNIYIDDIPEIKKRRPLQLYNQAVIIEEYNESDHDWFENNREAAIMLLEKAMQAQQDAKRTFPTRRFKCTRCGNIKDVIMNHDGLSEIWERCTDDCGWRYDGERGPVIPDTNGNPSGFWKRRYVRVDTNENNLPL